MKKNLLLLTIIFSICINAHSQHVHTYVTEQAYKLLEKTLGHKVNEIFFNIGKQPNQMQKGEIICGSWDEDVTDIVYGLTGNIFDGKAYVSCTHFWQGDVSDNFQHHLRGPAGSQHGPYPNAYLKLIQYAFPDPNQFNVGINVNFGAYQGKYIKYSSLLDFYKNGHCILSTVVYPFQINSQNITMNFFDREKIVYDILGRMCHLLQDMTVPAHVHLDAHGSDWGFLLHDFYEEEYINKSENYLRYNYNNINGFINPFSNPNNPTFGTEPLHFLMFTTNQITDCFASSDSRYWSSFDYNINGNYSTFEYNYLINKLNPNQLGQPYFDYLNQANHLMPLAIRATAGLLYWFMKGTDLLTYKEAISLLDEMKCTLMEAIFTKVDLLEVMDLFTINGK